ncbi:basic amino acid ABC transporter substrate-binding protein [Halobaculum sp. MBLA0143]|uniref:basic amino acid ABC transporter substrate-binding protein n=1 Tax=Halobaculum sp. MBLA0143 TaxID=3079933 RepID=UPI0035250742
MVRTEHTVDRRTYMKLVGASGVAGITATAGCATGTGGGAEEITPATAPGFPPFEMKNDEGELVGFDVDLLTAVVEETEYTLAGWEEFEFSSLIPALRNDRADVVAAAMTITDDRDESVDFSDSYYSADQAILVADGSDFAPSALSDLASGAVGAQEGTTGAGVVEEQLVNGGDLASSDFNTYGSYVLAVEDLVNGNVDAVVVDTPVANTFAAQRPVSVAFTYETGENYGFAVQEGDSDLQSSLSEGLTAVRESGTYEDLTAKYFTG